MKVTFEDAGPCRKVMHINAPAEAIRKEYDEVVDVYRRHAKVSGFRLCGFRSFLLPFRQRHRIFLLPLPFP